MSNSAVMALVDPGFLVEAGWDSAAMVLRPAADHPLLGRPVCRVPGCDNTARRPSCVCTGCEQRLAAHGLGEEAMADLPPLRRTRPSRCAVPGCQRLRMVDGLCDAHRTQRRRTLPLPREQFLTDPRVRPLPACPPCAVPACTLQRRGPSASYCHAHKHRWWQARRDDPGLDETAWRARQSASTRPGETSLRGLAPLVVAQLLLGIQERTRTGRRGGRGGSTRCWPRCVAW
ncbi:MAG TPA: hypothetical protein VFM55_09330 [Micromonosporaceae bacterium]|nr:hypothetical protein [Micromonosporaceae bacterium]